MRGSLAAVVCAGRLVMTEDDTLFIPACFEFDRQLFLSDVFRLVRIPSPYSPSIM